MSRFPRNLIVILGAAALQAIAFGIYETGMPLYLEFVGISLMSMGVIFGVSQAGMLAVRWFAGTGSDAVGRKPFYAWALGLSSLAMGTIPAWTGAAALAVTKTVRDMAGTMYDAVRPVAVYEEAGKRFLRWIGRVDGVIFTFIAVGAIATGWLIDSLGYRWPFIIASATGFIASAIIIRGYRERPRPAAAPAPLRFTDLFKFDLPRALWIIATSNFILNVGISTSHSFYQLLFFKDKFGFSLPALGALQMAHRLSLGIPMFFAGSLMDRPGLRRHLMSIYLAAVAGQSLCLAGAGLLPSAAAATLAFILHDLVGATFWGPINASLIQAHARPGRRGADVALVTGLSGLGWMLGPLLAGWLVDGAGWRDGPFVMSGAISLVGGMLMLRIHRARR